MYVKMSRIAFLIAVRVRITPYFWIKIRTKRIIVGFFTQENWWYQYLDELIFRWVLVYLFGCCFQRLFNWWFVMGRPLSSKMARLFGMSPTMIKSRQFSMQHSSHKLDLGLHWEMSYSQCFSYWVFVYILSIFFNV